MWLLVWDDSQVWGLKQLGVLCISLCVFVPHGPSSIVASAFTVAIPMVVRASKAQDERERERERERETLSPLMTHPQKSCCGTAMVLY